MKKAANPHLIRINPWHLFAAGVFLVSLFAAGAAAAKPVRETLSFDANWRFTMGDPAGTGDELNYTNIKQWVMSTGNQFVKDGQPTPRPSGNPGEDVSYTQPGFDDSGWQQLNLPHDWAIAGPFKQEYPGSTGKLHFWGVGWYRKHFEIPASDHGRRIVLAVDGAMSYANVWVNGQYVGGWPYGYASWQLDLTPYIQFGGQNVVAIRLDNPPDSSRWYPGAGIYRNVWLIKTGPVHVGQWGAYVTTPEVNRQQAKVKLQVTVCNEDIAPREIFLDISVLDPHGRVVGTARTPAQVVSNASAIFDQEITVKNPQRWDLQHPVLYQARVAVCQAMGQDAGGGTNSQNSPPGKLIVDGDVVSFGIRTINFDPDKGFFLNGKHVHLNGVCDHADLGALGTAINHRALQRQIQILQEMGCNAIRTSHNPPAPELLDLCDRMGMLVMDESFDCWEHGKRPNDYHLLFRDWHEKDWRAELERDRNHPSIILWSIGNEVPDQGRPEGYRIGAELTRIAHEEDPTRPTTAACDRPASGFDGFQTNLDVFGYNYKPFLYAKVHAANPGKPVIGTETASCISSRGEYFYPVSTNKNDGKSHFQMSSYDLSAPHWATIPDTEFRGQDENPFVGGEFVWTGFDYLGEPTPYDAPNDPSRSSYFGIVDLAGFKKDRFYLYQARWRPDFPMAHFVPQNWNWPDRTGQVTPVFVYTSGDSAELFLNGKSLGRKTKGQYEYRLCWNDVKYEPGKLKVVAWKNGKRWATDVVRTTGPAAKLVLRPDRKVIHADGKDLSFVTLAVGDKKGRTVPNADNPVHFEISGPGEIVATDNGDATDLTSFPSHDRKAFNGLALVIIRSEPGHAGKIKVKAESEGLKAANTSIRAREGDGDRLR